MMKTEESRFTSDFGKLFRSVFSFADKEQQYYSGMIDSTLEDNLNKKTKEIADTINSVEIIVEQEAHLGKEKEEHDLGIQLKELLIKK